MALSGVARREYDLQRRAAIRHDPEKLAIVREQNRKRDARRRQRLNPGAGMRRWWQHVTDRLLLVGASLYREGGDMVLDDKVVRACRREARFLLAKWRKQISIQREVSG